MMAEATNGSLTAPSPNTGFIGLFKQECRFNGL